MVTFEESAKHEDEKASSFKKFTRLFIIGFLMILIGTVILVVTAAFYGGSTNFGVIIFLWFIPIVIGAGPEPTWIILFAIILAVLGIIIFLATRWKGE